MRNVSQDIQHVPQMIIPDLPEIDPEKDSGVWVRTHSLELPVSIDHRPYVSRMTIERFPTPNLTDVQEGYIAQVTIELCVPHEKETELRRISVFKSVLKYGRRSEQFPQDHHNHLYWNILVRFVEKDWRKKGLGTFMLELMETAMGATSKALGKLRPEWIEIRTSLGSLSSMIIDRDWLFDALTDPSMGVSKTVVSRLSMRIEKEKNFGYIPHPNDQKAALALLQTNSEELADIPSSQKELLFLKPLLGQQIERLFRDV